MATARDSVKFLLFGPEAITKTIEWPVLLIFSKLTLFINYISENINATDSYVLIIPGIIIKQVINDSIYNFGQVRHIYVYYDNVNDLKQDKDNIKDEHKKLRFCLRENLPRLIEKLKANNAINSSGSNYRKTVNDVSTSSEQRISAKRPNSTDQCIPTPKRTGLKSKHGLFVRNIEQVDSHYKCPSCHFLFLNPYQLECGHRICECCIENEKVQTSCLTCLHTSLNANLWFDRGFHNEMLPLPVSCSLCDWTGLYGTYEKHFDQKHSDGVNTTALVDVYTQQSTQSGLSKSVHTTETHQQLVSDIVSASRFIYTPINNDLVNNEYRLLLNHFQEMIHVLSNHVNTISNKQQRLDTELRRNQASLQIINQNFFSIGTILQDNRSRIPQFQLLQDIHAQEIWSLKRDMHDALSTSHDGTYIWKITNVREKIADARSERQKSIYSPPFYSSPTGYKMCLRLYLNGDYESRGQYLSLFVVLMRHDYDAILKWPFSYKVIFRLYDQSTENDHSGDVIQCFSPDIQLHCFKRPEYNMNPACGIKQFLSVAQFEKYQKCYVEDDTTFIGVKIDFSNEYSSIPSLPGESPNDEEHVDIINENFMHMS